MTGGELGQFLLLAVYAGTAAASLSEMWSEVQRAAGAMERLVELQNSEPAIVAPPNPLHLPPLRAGEPAGRIQFEHVRFRYPSRPDSAALEDFTLTIEPGETVAFVGPSGAGKSTTFQLLLRFYDPERGRVIIDGVKIAERRAGGGAAAHRPRAAGDGAVRCERAREHPLWASRRLGRRDRGRRARGRGR